jgi:hypothetical protein
MDWHQVTIAPVVVSRRNGLPTVTVGGIVKLVLN